MDAVEEDEGVKAEKNLERRLGELEKIVSELEDTDCPITELIKKYSNGMALALECRRDLYVLGRQIALARNEAVRAFKKMDDEEALANEAWRKQHGITDLDSECFKPSQNFSQQGVANQNGMPNGSGNQGHW